MSTREQRDYPSTWGNDLEMDYAIPNDYSVDLRARLEENDPDVEVMRFPRWWEANDEDFAQLGQALMYNTNLRSIRLDSLHGRSLTTTGMDALADGIRSSRVKYLMLDGECPPEIQRSLYQGIWQSQTIQVISFVTKQVNVQALRDIIAPLTAMFIHTGPDLPFHLKNFSLRECEFDEDQVKLLSQSIGANRSIKSLALYKCSLTDDNIATFAKHWKATSSIQEIDLRCNRLTGYGANLILKAAGKQPAMQRVAFSENRGFGYEGFKFIGEELTTTKLNGFCFCEAVPTDLSSIPMHVRDEAFAVLEQALRRNESLNFIILRGIGMGPRGAQAIMRGLANHRNFSDLGLNKNEEIGYHGLKLIGEELGNAGLEDLNLESCVDSDTKASQTETRAEACQALADGLRQHASIKELKLGNNGIDSFGVQLLLSGVVNHPSMTKLSLDKNHSIGHEGLKYIGEALPNMRLEELDLTECTMGISDATLANSKLADAAGHALVEGIKHNIHLHQLHLHNNDLKEKWRKELEFYLDLNRCGRYLMRRDVPPAIWCDVFDFLEDETSHIYYFLKEQPWLVMLPAVASPSVGSRKRKACYLS